MPKAEVLCRNARGLALALVLLVVALQAPAHDARPGIFRITPLRPVAELNLPFDRVGRRETRSSPRAGAEHVAQRAVSSPTRASAP